MSSSARCLNASAAARQLGVSIKALRLYERHGLIAPGRTAAGYWTYGSDDMVRATEVVALRALGLSLAQVARVRDGDPHGWGHALAAHETAVDNEIYQLARKLDKVRGIRSDLA